MSTRADGAAQRVGQAAEHKASGGAAHADGAQQQHCGGRCNAVVERVWNEMHEGHEQAERAHQAGGIQTGEAARLHRLAQGKAGCRRGSARLQGIAVGSESPPPRIILDQKRHPHPCDRGEHAEHLVGAAPTQRTDQERRQRRHHQGADADAAHRQSRRKSAALDEPPLHGAERRHIGEAHAEPDAETIGHVHLRQACAPCRPRTNPSPPTACRAP